MKLFPALPILPALAATLLVAAPAFPQQGTAPDLSAPVPPDSNVRTGALPNGIRYYIRKNTKPEKRAELRLAVNAGSLQEDDDQQGLAHFVEHMAFNGTTHFKKNELVDYLESVGVEFGPHLNAYTSFDETVYMLTLPTDSARIMDKGFQILEDWAHGLGFEEEEIDKERGVVGEEWRLGLGAHERMRDKYYPVLYHGSRYAQRLPIGKKNIVDSASYETIRRFYRDWYRPELMAVVAVGDFDPDAVEAKIRIHFSKIAAPPASRKRDTYPVPDHSDTKVVIATDKEAPYTEVHVYYKHDRKAVRNIADYRQQIIRSLYSSMISDRLEELSRQADPPFSYASMYYYGITRSKDACVATAWVRENYIERGLETMLTEHRRVKEFGFTASELERKKKEILRNLESEYMERGKTESYQYVWDYVYHYLEGDPIPGIENKLQLYREMLPGILLDEVNAVAAGMTGEGNAVVVVTAPEKEGLTLPGEADILAAVRRAETQDLTVWVDNVSDEPLLKALPKPGSVTQERTIPEIGVTEWTLSNGVKVIVKPTDFKNDEVRMTAHSPGGSSLHSDADHMSAARAASVIAEGGVGAFDKIALDKKLSGRIVRVTPYISELDEGFYGSASPQDLETMFQLIHLYFTSPRRDSTAFLAWLARWEDWLQNRMLNPEGAFYDTASVTLNNYHYRRRPLTYDVMREIELAKTWKTFRERFADAGDFTFFFVGNLDKDTVKSLAARYLATLPATGRNERWKDIGLEYAKGAVSKTVRRGVEPKARVSMAFSGPFEWNDKNRLAMNAMTEVLRIKLRESLREDMGGVYGVSVWANPHHYPRERYTATISFGCDPDKLDDLLEAALKEVKKLQDEGATEKDLAKVKEMYRRQREVNLKENGFWLNTLESAWDHGEDPRGLLDYENRVNSLTAADIRDAARQYFPMANYVKTVLLPEGAPDH